MIIVKLMGGMGNQMFQYALGRNLSLKYNVPLKIDLSFLKNRNMGPNFVYRDYDLDIFNIEPDFSIDGIGPIQVVSEAEVVVDSLQSHFQYSQETIKYIEFLINSGINILIDGYWQSPLYFKEFESQIRKDFTFKSLVNSADDQVLDMLSKITSSNSVLINVRRTDYLKTDFHGVMGMDYINKAKSIIESKIQDPHYFIFSDDIDWCSQNLNESNMTIVNHSYKGHKFGYYLQLMSNCKHFIIPNSSFAWWSAFLNQNSDKIVITPLNWMANSSFDTKDLILDSWIRI